MNRLCVVFLVIVVVVYTTSIAYGDILKCCESNRSFEKINGTFKCSDNSSIKSHIFTSTTNFLENNTEGQCVEFFDDFYIFNLSRNVISQFQIVEEKKVYSKCCPLNFTYNTFTHGCEEAENAHYADIKDNFVKVGLPTCEVIVDITVENITEVFYNSDCVDRTTNGSFILRKCKESKDVCSEMRCVQKCCPDGQIFLNESHNPICIEGYQGINFTELTLRGASEFPEDSFATIITNKFPNLFLLNESVYPSYFNRKGTFSYSFNESRTVNETSDEYCIEYVETLDGYFFFFNDVNTSEEDIQSYYYYILPIDATMLSITILVYVLLNEVRKLFGNILVNYCLAMLIWDVALAYSWIEENIVDGCIRLAFIEMFGRTATFVWSNVLCWHIWRTFGSRNRTNDAVGKDKNYKKIIMYYLYGWGAPAILTLIIFLFYTYKNKKILPDVIQPHIAEVTCFFDKVPGNYSNLLFMDIPIILLQVVNIILFVKTAIYCLKSKNEINKMNNNTEKKKHFERKKAKLYLVVKLLLIMGVMFIVDAITTAAPMDGPILTYVDEVFSGINSTQGILIFIIFICNRQMYNKIKKKLGISNAGTATDSDVTNSSIACEENTKKNTNQNYATSVL